MPARLLAQNKRQTFKEKCAKNNWKRCDNVSGGLSKNLMTIKLQFKIATKFEISPIKLN